MASTMAKGAYANSVYELIHYAFGGVCCEQGLCLCPPLRLRGRIGVFRRRQGPSSLPVPGQSLLARLAVRGYLLRGDTSCRGSPPADRLSAGSTLPSSLSISSFSCSPIRATTGVKTTTLMNCSCGTGRTCTTCIPGTSTTPARTATAKSLWSAKQAGPWESASAKRQG